MTKHTTTIRLTEDDRKTIAELQQLTGLESVASVLRFSMREALVVRKALAEQGRARKGGK
jgi:hypothetical protein